jgi:hypothetical protein
MEFAAFIDMSMGTLLWTVGAEPTLDKVQARWDRWILINVFEWTGIVCAAAYGIISQDG